MLTTSRLLLMTTIGDSPTRLGERRCSTELLPPPSTSSNQPLPLLYSPPPSASQAQSFLLQVSSKPTEKGEEGGRPLGLGYNPTLCLSLLYLSLPASFMSNLRVCTLLRCPFVKHSLGKTV